MGGTAQILYGHHSVQMGIQVFTAAADFRGDPAQAMGANIDAEGLDRMEEHHADLLGIRHFVHMANKAVADVPGQLLRQATVHGRSGYQGDARD